MKISKTEPIPSDFSKNLKAVGRILEDPDYNVWGCSPIYDENGKVHVFYSRWKNEAHHQGWITSLPKSRTLSQNSAEGVFETVDVAISGRGGDWWDAMTCHNPTIHKVGDKYVLFYGNFRRNSLHKTRRYGDF